MEDQMRLLAALLPLLWIYTPVSTAQGCSGFRHLENGQTFFRYGGLLVIFRCHPGYKLHGYKTNSCVSGQWSRDTPVCVGSGCSSPGPLNHGTSSMNEDGSWAEFTCDSGFQLHGPSMLYCKGRAWNSTKPVCRESDMMSSVWLKPNIHLNLQAAVVLKNLQQSHYATDSNTASKEANLKLGSSALTTSQMSNGDRAKVTHPKINLQQQSHFSSFKINDGVQTSRHETQRQETNEVEEPETGINGDASEVKTEKMDKVPKMPSSKSYSTTSASSTVSLVSEKERLVASPSFFPTSHSLATNTSSRNIIPTVMSAPTSQLNPARSAFPELINEGALKFEEHGVTLEDVPPSEGITASSQTEDKKAEAESKYQPLSQVESIDKVELTVTSTQASSAHFVSRSSSFSSPASSGASVSTNHPSFSTLTSITPTSTQASAKTNPPNSTTITEPSFTGTQNDHPIFSSTSGPPLFSLTSIRRPVCPYPPVPTHGTFYFRNVDNPGPRQYRHYIQYACYPGFTLAHGDIHSYCQQGSWSGITPVCLELTPCSVNNGGCSQLCSHSHQYNHSSKQTQTSTECHCRPGFTLLDDRRTCRDVDECAEQQHQCQHRCNNTFGSFKCSCDDGYRLAPDQISCTDVDDCLLPAAETGCMFGCVNTPGSFYCQCPTGYRLQTADGRCHDIDECSDNQGLGPCMEECINTSGSYRCSCTHGHILAKDGQSCITGCPPGYRKRPSTTPENSTAQTPREECEDINECLEADRCGWQCVNLPGLYRCMCPRGYTLQRDGRRCRDINECSWKNGGCSHLCVNQKGGYKCACPTSHRLSPNSWKKCVPRTTATTAG